MAKYISTFFVLLLTFYFTPGNLLSAPADTTSETKRQAKEYYDLGLKLEKEAEALKKSGKNDDAKKKLKDAIKEYNNAIKKYPDMIEPYMRLGEIYFSDSLYQDALRNYSKAFSLDPQNKDAKFYTAYSYYKLGNDDKAIPLLKEICNERKDFSPPFYLLGMYYYNNKMYDEAIEPFKSYLIFEPNDANIHGTLGNIYLKKNMFDEASSQFEEVIRIDPNNALAQINLGSIYFNQGKFDKAIARYESATKLNPNIPVIYVNLGACYHKQKMWDKAIESYKKALTLDSKSYKVYYYIGDVYLEMGKEDMALENYKKSLEINSKYYWAYYKIGDIYYGRGNLDLAIEQYRKALDIQPDESAILSALGKAYYQKGILDEAIRTQEKAVELSPSKASFRVELGMAYYKKQMYEQAEKEFESALGIEPTLKEARDNLILTLYQRGSLLIEKDDLIEARKIFIKALKQDSTKAESWTNLGICYLKNKQYDDAKKHLLQSISLQKNGKSHIPYLYLGYISFNKEEIDTASKYFNLALKYGEENKKSKGTLAPVYNAIGSIYAIKGDNKSAIENWKKAISDDSLFCDACKNLGYIYYEMDSIDEAMKSTKRAINICGQLTTDENIKFHNILAYCYYKKGDFNSAKSEMETVYKLKSDDPTIMFNLAVIYESANEFDKGIPIMESLLKSYPDKKTKYSPILVDLYRKQGNKLFEQKKYNEALAFYKKAVALNPNDLHSQIGIGAVYYQTNDYQNAKTTFENVIAKQQIPEALFNLGIYYDVQEENKLKAYQLYVDYVKKGGSKSDDVKDLIKQKERIFGFKQ